jgi:ATP-dependent Zn protease
MVEDRYTKVKTRLSENRDVLERVATVLLDKETLDEKEFMALVQKPSLPAVAPQTVTENGTALVGVAEEGI